MIQTVVMIIIEDYVCVCVCGCVCVGVCVWVGGFVVSVSPPFSIDCRVVDVVSCLDSILTDLFLLDCRSRWAESPSCRWALICSPSSAKTSPKNPKNPKSLKNPKIPKIPKRTSPASRPRYATPTASVLAVFRNWKFVIRN